MRSLTCRLHDINPPELLKEIFDEYGPIHEPPIKELKKNIIIEYWLDGERRVPMLAVLASCNREYVNEVIRVYLKENYEKHT